MKATYLNKFQGINRNHRKENNFDGSYMVLSVNENGEIDTKIDCRLYSTQSTNYCCIWISGQDEMISGSGKAGGYGYHRMSAAVSDALKTAGFALNENISGVGETAVKDALMAVAAEMGVINPQIIHAHA